MSAGASRGATSDFRYEMADSGLSFAPPTRMNSGVPDGLSCCAMTWSSEVPTGRALNRAPASEPNGSLLLGVTGCNVKYDPTTCRCESFPWPRPLVPLLLYVHSFIARMPRGISSLPTNGASGARLVGVRSSAVIAPCDFAGNHLVVRQP